MRRVLFATLALALVPATARSEFEGVLESKMTNQGGGGAAREFVSKVGTRTETEVVGETSTSMITMIILKSRPGVVFLVNDAKKTYFEIDPSKAKEAATKTAPENFTVKQLGSERIAGLDCVHVHLKSDAGEEREIWATKELGSATDYWASQPGRDLSGLLKALRESGADGWPVKWVLKRKGSEATVEVTKVTKGAVAAALFDLKSYRKTGGAAEQLQRLPEMTPDQRSRFEAYIRARTDIPAGDAPRRHH
jgi:Domain of unknown function (DUF4412)